MAGILVRSALRGTRNIPLVTLSSRSLATFSLEDADIEAVGSRHRDGKKYGRQLYPGKAVHPGLKGKSITPLMVNHMVRSIHERMWCHYKLMFSACILY